MGCSGSGGGWRQGRWVRPAGGRRAGTHGAGRRPAGALPRATHALALAPPAAAAPPGPAVQLPPPPCLVVKLVEHVGVGLPLQHLKSLLKRADAAWGGEGGQRRGATVGAWRRWTCMASGQAGGSARPLGALAAHRHNGMHARACAQPACSPAATCTAYAKAQLQAGLKLSRHATRRHMQTAGSWAHPWRGLSG